MPGFSEHAAFAELYNEVTDRLERARGRTEAESLWLQQLVAGFKEKFRSWNDDPSIRTYLDRTEAASRRGDERSLQLVGHVYLHVAYDLPRVVADSLVNPPVSLRLERARTIFQSLAPAFIDVFEQTYYRPSIFGRYGRIAQILRKFFPTKTVSIVRGQGQWVLNLRSNAWITGENLSRAGRSRVYLEEQLLQHVEMMSRSVMPFSADPIQWMAGLQSPVLSIDPLQFAAFAEETRVDDRLQETGTENPDDFL